MNQKYYNNDSKKAMDIRNKQIQQLNKRVQQLNKQIKKGLKMTALTVGIIGVAKYYYKNKDQFVDTNVDSPIKIEDIVREYKYNGIKMDADDILSDYSKVTTLYDMKEVNAVYQGKYLEVTGDFHKNYINSIDGDFITLKGDENWYSTYMTIECEFADKIEIDKLKELDKGDEIVVVGECLGSDGVTVKLEDCYVKELDR